MGNWMSAANQQDQATTGGGDGGGITRRLEELNIKDQAGAGQDPTTGHEEAGGVARRVKDFCDKAVANLKEGRLVEAFGDASEALELDEKDAKAAALYRYTIYVLDPEKRLLDKALALCKEAHPCFEAGDYDKALELLTLAKKWHYGVGLTGIFLRSAVNFKRRCFSFDLAYLDAAEALAETEDSSLVELQKACLHSLGFKLPPMIEPQQRRVDELPAHSPLINQPNGVLVESLLVDLESCAIAMDASYSTLLVPPIPLDQLASFINEQVQGAVKNLAFKDGDGPEDTMLRLLDDVSERLCADELIFTDFFHLPWGGVKRILDGRTLRGDVIRFLRLQLPSGVDPNELLKLPAILECTLLIFHLYDKHRSQLPGLPPLFKNAALVEWLKCSVDGRQRQLWVTREYLSSGLLGFLDALKNVVFAVDCPLVASVTSVRVQDFQQATRAHSYCVMIQCPDFDVADGLGVRREQLSNRLGERMTIVVGEDPQATAAMRHRVEMVAVERSPRT